MSNQTEPDFMFSLNVPINLPTEEEVAVIRPHLEEYLNQLISSGHLTEEEAVAFVKFSSELGSYVPFMMDPFLQSYRKQTSEKVQEVRENAEASKTKIIT